MTVQTVPYEVFQREREKRIQAEKDRDYYKREFFLARKIRQAPVIRPIDKDVLEEFRHVQKWGTVEDTEGNKRANYNTIASKLHVSPDTVARSAERLEKLHIAEIREHQGPQDERERKYLHVGDDKLDSIDKLEDPDHIVKKQGGNRYICMNENCNSTDVAVRKETTTKTTIHCNVCHEEHVSEETDDTGWKMQIGHKTQKQLAFKQSIHTIEAEKQLADHCVYTLSIDDTACAETSQKQVAFVEPPLFLRNRRIWCVGRKEWNEERQKFDKVPYIADMLGTKKALSNNPSTWRTYEQARAILATSQEWTQKNSPPFDFLMFMCDGTFTFADWDHCVDKETGEIQEDALEQAKRINSYTEYSWSGDGIHSYAEGKLPPGRRRNDKIEIYDSGRPCVYTGRPVPEFPLAVERRTEEIHALHSELFPHQNETEPLWDVSDDECTDEEIGVILAKATQATNGAKFMKLYSGDASDYPKKDGSPDYSAADFALCHMLAYWTKNNVSTIDRIFRKSGLMRDKWDKPARSGETYGQGTIKRALCQQERKAS